ncbi:MAG: 16S rRNA (cytosine(1402)-N(4))-methyltransferase RsmH [Wenzhouxiangellaceae bacterium]
MNHVPVLEEAAVNALDVRVDGTYLDATFGRGGHARLILDRLGPRGLLIALDADPEAIAFGEREFGDELRVKLVRCNFRELADVVREFAPQAGVDGILMDLGVSSPQLDSPERGFSFRHDGPLDMRLDPDTGVSAADWLARVDEAELVDVLYTLGEERFSRRIARAVVEARDQQPIRTTAGLAAIVEKALPAHAAHASRIHPATRTFQAIRIAVNAELEALDEALQAAIEALAPGGRLVVISFHSLEDRRVKHAIRAAASAPPASRRMPGPPSFQPRLKAIGKLVRPADAEQAANPRARSARMRVAERLPTGAPGGAS